MKYFDIEIQTKYYIKLSPVEIDDAGENFIDEDELSEMGISYSYGGTTIFMKKARTALARLERKIQKSGKKSCPIDDDELVEMLKDTDTPVSDFVNGLRRVGNRLSIYTKPAKLTPNKRDGKRFIDTAVRYIKYKYNKQFGTVTRHGHGDFVIEVKGGMENVCEGAFRFVVHNMNWDEYVVWISNSDYENGYGTYIVDDLEWFKMIYDNPAIFDSNGK